MAMITYDNKSTLNPQPSVANANKVSSGDMNEIKSVVNTNYGEVGNIANLNTTDKSSVVNAINELKGGEIYSTSEVKTNKTLNGKPIYRSYVTYTHSATGNYTYNHNLNIETLVSANIFLSVAGQTISSHGYRPNPYISGNNSFHVGQITQNSIVSTATGWSNNTVYAWLEYTKTTD
jgi:hypothetical protein